MNRGTQARQRPDRRWRRQTDTAVATTAGIASTSARSRNLAVSPNPFLPISLLAVAWLTGLTASAQDDFDAEPIRYSASTPENKVTDLERRVAAGETRLEYDERFGWLPSLLKSLQVPESSQSLVFSKTSLQRHKIGPRRPRAIYFNDQIYVGFCQGGEVLELSAVDPQLGTVFYTLDQHERDRPVFMRQGDSCLICHGSSQTRNIPGHLVRSVFADREGQPILSSGSYRIDHTSPLSQRWGGWYVSGTHGDQKHLGNLIVAPGQTPTSVDNVAGQNVSDLAPYFDTRRYLTPHSDLVALMVLEHQALVHNQLVRANFLGRTALHHEQELNKELDKRTDFRWDSTTSRLRDAVDPLVKALLFSGEARLTARLAGTSDFATQFAAQGPRDSLGRSLRDFDMSRRMFRYPCSYLIYSVSFDRLPDEVRELTYRRLWQALSPDDTRSEFSHLSAEDRIAIREILRDTKPDLPDYWRVPEPGSSDPS